MKSGSMSFSTAVTSARLPTGRIVVFAWFADPRLDVWLARFTRICHQPAGRQSSGWLTSIEWMRPGGSVSLLVENSPNPTRTPSGVPAMV